MLRLTERCGLTLYDATYLELAQQLELPLATLIRIAGPGQQLRLWLRLLSKSSAIVLS